jgi:hypothetical protein
MTLFSVSVSVSLSLCSVNNTQESHKPAPAPRVAQRIRHAKEAKDLLKNNQKIRRWRAPIDRTLCSIIFIVRGSTRPADLLSTSFILNPSQIGWAK